jgi:hypothetical protein
MEDKLSPIQRTCQELVDQVNRIREGATIADYSGFEPFLQESLIL